MQRLEKELIVSLVLEECETQSEIRLEGAVDIACAAELKKLLLQALESGKELRVSLERAICLDVTAVQLFWAAGCEARRLGLGFTFAEKVPEEISSALAVAGFESLLVSENGSQAGSVR
jgi:hypothetical protein